MLSRGRRLYMFAVSALLVLPALVEAQRLPGTTSRLAIFPSPQGVTAGWTKMGVQVSWLGVPGAARYLVLRGPDTPSLTQIAAVAPDQAAYLDQGFNANAVYQIIAVSSAGARGASVVVAYVPPVAIAMAKPTPTLTTLGARSMPMGQTAASGLPPVITSLDQPPAGAKFARNGETVLVQGTGLDALSSVVLMQAQYSNGGFLAGGGTYPAGWYPSGPPYPVTPVNVSQNSFSFVPQVLTPGNLSQGNAYVVIVTKGSAADTSNDAISIAGAMPVRKITGVAKTVVRSGGRVDVYGVGLNEVSGGFFGPGLPGSATNPFLNVWNRSATAVQLETPSTCNMEGFLELRQVPLAGESAVITPNPAIKVACIPAAPTGTVVGSNSVPNNVLPEMPGGFASIQGTHLKYVTRVIDQNGLSYPFTYTNYGSFERLTMTLPKPNGEAIVAFSLENPLTNPVELGTVTGRVLIMAAPLPISAYPAWAEPGQLVHLYGSRLKYSAAPQVFVGGVPAQVVTAAANTVSFRLAAGTTSGPIEIQNEVGKTTLPGGFLTSTQLPHPGFFVVSGPSVVTSVTAPNATLAYGDILTVTGQNLARLGGICVRSSGQGGTPTGATHLYLRRSGNGSTGSAQMGAIASNTTMQVLMEWQPFSAAAGPIQLYQSTQPVGDQPPTTFACTAQTAVVNWPP